MSYKNIIVAIDGSETSSLALNEAIKLSISLQAKLSIIYVVDEFPVNNIALGIDFDRYREEMIKEGTQILDTAKQIAKKNHLAVEVELVEIDDASKNISKKIIETVLKLKSDLLVLGTHGRGGFNRLILGSVAEETIRVSPIPVLLVRAKEKN